LVNVIGDAEALAENFTFLSLGNHWSRLKGVDKLVKFELIGLVIGTLEKHFFFWKFKIKNPELKNQKTSPVKYFVNFLRYNLQTIIFTFFERGPFKSEKNSLIYRIRQQIVFIE